VILVARPIAKRKMSAARKRNRAEAQPRQEAGLTLRIDMGDDGALGPGKVRLLELIAELGSISAAGRAMGMSYRRAWLLVEDLNSLFRQPSINTRHGGKGGGSAVLTDFGRELAEAYRDIERLAAKAAEFRLRAIGMALRKRPANGLSQSGTVKRGSQGKTSNP
jgi:molybdate transport system regulatory protein